jgi:hypothetical protein
MDRAILTGRVVDRASGWQGVYLTRRVVGSFKRESGHSIDIAIIFDSRYYLKRLETTSGTPFTTSWSKLYIPTWIGKYRLCVHFNVESGHSIFSTHGFPSYYYVKRLGTPSGTPVATSGSKLYIQLCRYLTVDSSHVYGARHILRPKMPNRHLKQNHVKTHDTYRICIKRMITDVYWFLRLYCNLHRYLKFHIGFCIACKVVAALVELWMP